MLIDTHCHLDQITDCDEYSQLISAIRNPVITMGTVFPQFSKALCFHAINQNIVPACGFHPWFINNESLDLLQLFAEFCLQHKVRVIGEIGLDLSKNYRATSAIQLDVLAFELAFACEHDLAVSIHVYKAYDPLYDLLKRYPVRGVLHSFPGGWQQARRFTDLGLKIGINGLILRPQAVRYIELVNKLSIESLVVETDAPNVHYPDGRAGDLSMLPLVAQQIANIKKMSFEDVCRITTRNALEVFKLDEFM